MPVLIPLSRGLFATVDEEDAERVLALAPWHAVESDPGRFYAARNTAGSRLYLHRFLTGAAAGVKVDHRSGNGLDCTRDNIRICTHGQNMQNRARHRQNKSGFKGVRLQAGRWHANIAAEGRQRFLGTFATPEEAAAGYDAAAVKLHGQFARLNFLIPHPAPPGGPHG